MGQPPAHDYFEGRWAQKIIFQTPISIAPAEVLASFQIFDSNSRFLIKKCIFQEFLIRIPKVCLVEVVLCKTRIDYCHKIKVPMFFVASVPNVFICSKEKEIVSGSC